MVVEFRRIGRRWAIYTNEVATYKRINKYATRVNKVPYIKNGKLVGMDFYFNEKPAPTIQKVAKGQLHLGI